MLLISRKEVDGLTPNLSHWPVISFFELLNAWRQLALSRSVLQARFLIVVSPGAAARIK